MTPHARGQLRLVGYWRPLAPDAATWDTMQGWEREHLQRSSETLPDLPSVTDHVDDQQDADDRRAVMDHLVTGTLVNQYRGLSRCRVCGRDNGSAELADGTFCWPEGLAHYVSEHAVRLPDGFEQHVLDRRPVTARLLPGATFDDEVGHRDRTWPGDERHHLLWTPDAIDPAERVPTVRADLGWWIRQTSG